MWEIMTHFIKLHSIQGVSNSLWNIILYNIIVNLTFILINSYEY